MLEHIDIIKILLPMALAFFVGIGITPLVSHYLYKHKCWKKKAGKKGGYGGGETPIFNALHKDKEVNTPRMGGVVVWGAVLATAALLWVLPRVVGGELLYKLEFVSRMQTWLPLMALMVGALVGLVDDILEIRGGGGHFAGGLSLKKRLAVVGAFALFAGWWFYDKLDVSSVALPLDGVLEVGWLFVPFFVLVALAVYASGVIDGIDGLAAGVFAIIFAAYGVIAFAQQQVDLAAFCATMVGALLAFLWFNIPPARFYLTETGTMALTLTLTVVAFMSDTLADGRGVAVLPIVGFLLVATVCMNVVQVLSKKLRGGKKVLLVAPLHHHFEAIGWPREKITMRYWVLGMACAFVGVIVALLGSIL